MLVEEQLPDRERQLEEHATQDDSIEIDEKHGEIRRAGMQHVR